MQVIKAVAATLAILAILFIVAVYGASRWAYDNREEIAKGVGTSIGIGREVRIQCEQMEARYRREWDEAVDSNTIDRRESDFDTMRQSIDAYCKPK